MLTIDIDVRSKQSNATESDSIVSLSSAMNMTAKKEPDNIPEVIGDIKDYSNVQIFG